MKSGLTIIPHKNTLKVSITDLGENGDRIENSKTQKTIVERDSL
jgi:hypothetical protein